MYGSLRNIYLYWYLLTKGTISKGQQHLMNIGHHYHISNPYKLRPSIIELRHRERMNTRCNPFFNGCTCMVLFKVKLLFQKQMSPSLLTLTMFPSFPGSSPLLPPLATLVNAVMRLKQFLWGLNEGKKHMPLHSAQYHWTLISLLRHKPL